ncbi:probable glycosyltransferase At3g07620 [Rutidosis leptorrhynchoides]|uniref:probable glycosyltransferase At3g07620 n=1 Tax=Rutidosis leptorrhynchoides TaxID=125765 RepID=UPI003A994C8A
MFNHILENKRLVWVVVVLFGVVIMLQYFEFPYFASSQIPKTITNNTSFTYTLQEKDSNASSPMSTSSLPPLSSPESFITPPLTIVDKNTSTPHLNPSKPVLSVDTNNKSFVEKVPRWGKVVTISDMQDMLLHNRATIHSMNPKWPSKVDQELLDAKLQIENTQINDNDRKLYPLYHNISRFKRSYELMEKTLKVYIYKEGEKPIFHQPNLKGIYASEGWFMKHMEENKHFVTKDPKQAHLFYIPFSSKQLEVKLFVPGSHNHQVLVQYLKNYHDMISRKYSFWNRTDGSDHFAVACHDWATSELRKSMDGCIRAICNSDVRREDFQLGKDVSLPETNVRSPANPLLQLGGKPSSKRPILAFFAGQMHGYLRPILLQHWENKDPDMKIYGDLRKSNASGNYIKYMKSSKYCICAKGYEVNSPRVVEAIFFECVPVIISDNFVPPFFEILNWESFAVFIQEKDIPNLKNILLSISNKRYRMMQESVKKVQQHFLWHVKPVEYDIFHMILHSIWYKRVFRV